MNRLKDAYMQVMQIYNDEGLQPGLLEYIGFSGKWVTVFGSMNQCGMAFNFTGEHAVYGKVDPEPLIELKKFVGKDLTYLADYIEDMWDILHRSLYLAVLNALSGPLNNPELLKKRGFSFVTNNDFDFAQKDDFVTVIGAGGVVKQLQKRCDKVHVSDMRSENTLESVFVGNEIHKGPRKFVFHSPEENEKLLSQSDIVFMTGSTLVNQTIFDLLPMIKKARVIGLFGPSAMLLPDFLRNIGVNYISTSHITNTKLLYEHMFDGFGGRIPDECMANYTITI